MDKLKQKAGKHWSSILAWINEDVQIQEEDIIKRINEINADTSLNQLKPKLSSPLSTLQDIESHFLSCELDLHTIKVYALALKIPKLNLAAFLLSVLEGSAETKYYSIPSSSFSKMYGRPCKTRDLIHLECNHQPFRKLCKYPSLLLSCDRGIVLYVAGKPVQCLENLQGMVIAIPTSSALEQFALVCDLSNGKTTLLSTTRMNIQVLGNFDLDKPEDEEIGWVDVIPWYNNEMILCWGGTDALRGQTTWQYFSGMNIPEIDDLNEFFVETNVTDEAYASLKKDCFEGMSDFLRHGSMLTSWVQLIDTEEDGKRVWKPKTTIAMDQWCIKETDEDCKVWGSPCQYLSICGNECRLWESGKKKFEMSVEPCTSFCLLLAHSKTMQ